MLHLTLEALTSLKANTNPRDPNFPRIKDMFNRMNKLACSLERIERPDFIDSIERTVLSIEASYARET